jgi:hypothetical protein
MKARFLFAHWFLMFKRKETLEAANGDDENGKDAAAETV